MDLEAFRQDIGFSAAASKTYYPHLRDDTQASLARQSLSLEASMEAIRQAENDQKQREQVEYSRLAAAMTNHRENNQLIYRLLEHLPKTSPFGNETCFVTDQPHKLHSLIDTVIWLSNAHDDSSRRQTGKFDELHTRYIPYYVIGYSYERGSILGARALPQDTKKKNSYAEICSYRPIGIFKSRAFRRQHESDGGRFDIASHEDYISSQLEAYQLTAYSPRVTKQLLHIVEGANKRLLKTPALAVRRPYKDGRLHSEMFSLYNVASWTGRLAARFEVDLSYMSQLDQIITDKIARSSAVD